MRKRREEEGGSFLRESLSVRREVRSARRLRRYSRGPLGVGGCLLVVSIKWLILKVVHLISFPSVLSLFDLMDRIEAYNSQKNLFSLLSHFAHSLIHYIRNVHRFTP